MQRGETRSGKQRQGVETDPLQDLLVEELRDLYHAEKQLVKALPEMSNAAHDPELKQSFQNHLKQTEGHVKKVEDAFELLGEKARTKTCKGMMGLIEEGKETIAESKEMDQAAADLALITVAQKVEHYEISSYGTVRTIAEQMGKSDVAQLLSEIEQQEKETDKLLTEAAQPMLQELVG